MDVLRKIGIYGSAALVTGIAAVIASCGGGGGDGPPPGPTPTQTTIDLAGVTKALADVGGAVPMCTSGSTTVKSVAGGSAPAGFTWLAKGVSVLQGKPARAGPALKALPPVQPPDQLGDCGGRMGYANYSHTNGTTTATLSFDNYCAYDAGTGTNQIVDGSISIVDTGTPGSTGPITQKIEAQSPSGLTVQVKDTAGTLLTTQKISFTGFVYTPGVPGGDPVEASPDTFRVAELKAVNAAGQTYRQTGYVVTYFITTTGGEQMSVAGRGYRSNGDYYDVSTIAPMVMSAAGDILAGQFSISGAGGSNAVATFVPGPVPLIDLTVNGAAVPGLGACS